MLQSNVFGRFPWSWSHLTGSLCTTLSSTFWGRSHRFTLCLLLCLPLCFGSRIGPLYPSREWPLFCHHQDHHHHKAYLRHKALSGGTMPYSLPQVAHYCTCPVAQTRLDIPRPLHDSSRDEALLGAGLEPTVVKCLLITNLPLRPPRTAFLYRKNIMHASNWCSRYVQAVSKATTVFYNRTSATPSI